MQDKDSMAKKPALDIMQTPISLLMVNKYAENICRAQFVPGKWGFGKTAAKCFLQRDSLSVCQTLCTLWAILVTNFIYSLEAAGVLFRNHLFLGGREPYRGIYILYTFQSLPLVWGNANSLGCHLPLWKQAVGESRKRGNGRSFQTGLLPRQSRMSWVPPSSSSASSFSGLGESGYMMGFFMLSDDILWCIAGLAKTTVRDKGIGTWHYKKPGFRIFQPVNIVTEAVSAKMSYFFFGGR